MGRPPQSKYNTTWDVSTVTSYLKTSLSPCSSLQLKQLTLKVVTLVALTTAQRCQSLHSLNLSDMKVLDDKIVFVIKDRLKTSRPGKPNSRVDIAAFPKDLDLCPRAHLLSYIKESQPLRGAGQSVINQLFISYVKPHKAVSSATIARWLKVVLHEASVDTSLYKAHSFRSAATSNALFKGASLADILKHADWSSVNTFNRFYNKPIVRNDHSFGNLIFS